MKSGSPSDSALLHTLLLLVLVSMLAAVCRGSFMQETPFFSAPISNVTARVGHTAQLACQVENLGPYKSSWLALRGAVLQKIKSGETGSFLDCRWVAWVQQATGAVLTVGMHVLTSNERVTVQRPSRSTWLLQLTHVALQDAGRYMCQLSTSPPRKLYGYLTVVEPPKMLEGNEWLDLDVGASVTLSCAAKGIPSPSVVWKREDGSSMRLNLTHTVPEVKGETLTLTDIQPTAAGRYQCVASNGHPPSASKYIQVGVRFAPVVIGPGTEDTAELGGRYTFRCRYAAHPRPDIYIIRSNDLGDQTITQDYFRVVPVADQQPTTNEMFLEMTRLEASDFGVYRCLVNNSEGFAVSETLLREAPVATTTLSPVLDSPPLIKGPHLLLHRDNLTVPLLVNAYPHPEELLTPTSDLESGMMDEDQNALESRKRPSSNWPRKIGRVSLLPKNRESASSAPCPVRPPCHFLPALLFLIQTLIRTI
ncbi:Immunoglobulin I-set [Trinorchestia longiramus]|nr:Immunoglobulin I-set [Trinorchestia longiramus]